ncbi:hypothetical protein A447_02708 [Fusobacterium vincentii ATCC 51190]|jgi:hypothetical protein|uniref:Uncharacterized protein n=1 Tax=Fusobacterium vincentii TaxID=155615 RepID=A0AAJ1FN48_FUSVC|nr:MULTISPECIES: hypothetical protein [Fusobacterium]ETT08815.1 hypothetical protein HMPREF1497_1462 [Fusobacterium sp. CM21]EJG09736.1 hypothetical protein A447_02708 [Fusobacterium vincentii ATCC 51190]ERT44226.1 hypothetical protein HMPREF1768_02015 [Fusobacterium nucleatum CTI-7]MCW0264228.1 hypothetical protein [Fusobacterium vincentii]MDH2315456.1 hypothetical protein [Fusobacterium nucleatum]
MKELKISPVPEKKSLRFVAHWLMMMPILPFIFLGIIYYVIDKKILNDLYQQILENRVYFCIFVFLWLFAAINLAREIFSYLLIEEVCYVENKVFHYQKFRIAFGMRKLMKKLEIPLSEILEVKEGKKPFFLYFLYSIIIHRNAVEIKTRDGKKYEIINSIVFGDKDSQSPNSSVTNERIKKILNKVKEMIFKTKNTLNF